MISDRFDQMVGELASYSTLIESELEQFILSKICTEYNVARSLMHDFLMTNCSFKMKLDFVMSILEEHEVSPDLVKSVRDDVKFIQETRNIAAHGDRINMRDGDGNNWLEVRRRKITTTKKDAVVLDEKFMAETHERYRQAADRLRGLSSQTLPLKEFMV